MDGHDLAAEYYRTIDEDEYETLASILADGFVHYRPDMTLDGRDRFVSFMRDERPVSDTEHTIEAVYATDDDERIAAEGELVRADGDVWFRFVDTFAFDDGKIATIRTYTDEHPSD